MEQSLSLLKREIGLNIGSGAGTFLSIVFFFCLVIVFPFGIGPDLDTLQVVGPAILWVGPLLAVLLGIDRVFQADVEDGSMDVLLMSDMSLEGIVAVKACAQWICSALPLIACVLPFGLMLGLDQKQILGALISLSIGTPALIFIGVLCGAVAVPVKRGGVLVSILATPLLIPTMIFGVSVASGFGEAETGFKQSLLLLTALSLFSGVVGCFGGAAILKFLAK